MDVDYAHVSKRPRLAQQEDPSCTVTLLMSPAFVEGTAPQSPFPSILESDSDGAVDSELYINAVSDGEHHDGGGMQQTQTDAAARSLSAGSTTSVLLTQASIPGLFLLEERNSLASSEPQLPATMDSQQAQFGGEIHIYTVASERVTQMAENHFEGSTEGGLVMKHGGGIEPKQGPAILHEHATGEAPQDDITSHEIGAIASSPKSPTGSSNSVNGERATPATAQEPPQNVGQVMREESEIPPKIGNDKEPVELAKRTEDMLEMKKPPGLRGKAACDLEFLAAAEANKDDENAEWQFDSSDAESSTDDDASHSAGSGSEEDSVDDSDSEAEDAEFPRLSLAEQAKILMAGDLDEDGEKAPAKFEQLRTKNELPEDAVEVVKPNVILTEADKLQELGDVQSVVDKVVLIKAKTSGEYQVLNEGSVVALANRSVIGVVSDLLGRVQSPLYTVRFKSKEEVQQYGVGVGTKIFYSPRYSSYVFTKALKAQRGSDASNIHDEEVSEHEVEFSDDEAEAEYKRKLKEKRSGGDKGGKGAAGRQRHAPLPSYAGPSSALADDEPYQRLPRPANLSDIMKSVAHMKQPEEPNGPPMDRHHRAHRADGGASDVRGRAGRGGSRGGRGGNRENGRGNWQSDGGGSRGGRDRDTQHTNSGSPTQPHNSGNTHLAQLSNQQTPPGAQHYPQAPQTPQYEYHYGGYAQQQAYSQTSQQGQHTPAAPFHFSPPATINTQSNYNYQPQVASPQSNFFAPSPLSPPLPVLPQGAHVNPAFFARQAQATQQQTSFFNPQVWGQQQQQSPPPNQGQFNWGLPVQDQPIISEAVMKAVQDQLDILKGVKK